MKRAVLGFIVLGALAACGDPMKSLPRLDDVSVESGPGQANILEPDKIIVPEMDATQEPRRGLLGFLNLKAQEAKAVPQQDMSPTDEALASVDGQTPVVAEPGQSIVEAAPAQATKTLAEKPRRGLFARLRKKPAPEGDPVVLAALPAPAGVTTDAPADSAEPDVAQEAAPVPQAPPAAQAPKKRGFAGLFGRRDSSRKAAPNARRNGRQSAGPKPGAPDYQIVPAGVSLPYGQMARVCDVRSSKLGRKVAKASKFTLLDSKPGSEGARNFYLTGFDDKCARQFTASLVMLSSPEEYEIIHFGPAGAHQPKGQPDAAYKKLRRKVCRVSEKKTCGGAKMKSLNKSALFVTVYQSLSSNPKWKNILLHDGEVLAMDVKG
jgi:hypothetical protein